jgi:hypothetical protein
MHYQESMSYAGGASLTTGNYPGPGSRRGGLVGWVFQREVAVAHRSYWLGCRSPLHTALAVLLYPLWLLVALPIAFLLGLVKMALLGALLTAVVAGATGARALALAPAPAPRHRR